MPARIAQGLAERLAQHQADVLDRVVGVDLDVTTRVHGQIEQPVPRQRVEHVRQERHRRVERPGARAIEPQLDHDLRLLGVALDPGAARGGHAVL
jgi:hypothetical protein